MSVRRTFAAALLSAAALATGALGGGAGSAADRSRDEFDAGTPDGVSIGGRGELRVAPRIEELLGAAGSRAWDLAIDDDGRIVAATGGPGTVTRIDPRTGATEELLRLEEDVQAVAVDGNVVYAATSPQGKVYRIAPGGAPETWFAPTDRYIWDLAVDSRGKLYVATGDPGRIYRVDAAGDGRVVFEGPESHLRCLAVDSRDRVLAGSEGAGYLYRLAAGGPTEVLFAPAEGEITDLAIGTAGSIFVAALGEPASPAPRRDNGGSTPGVTRVTVTAAAEPERDPRRAENGAPAAPAASTGRLASSVYEVRPAGTTRRVYSSEVDRVHALAWTASGVVAGTGDRGAFLLLAGEPGSETRLAQAQAAHVTALAAAPSGEIYAGTANPGAILDLRRAADASGTYLSGIKDAGEVADWGRVAWDATIPAGASLEIAARTGNSASPDDTWSEWSAPYGDADGSATSMPAGRYLQYRAELRQGAGGDGPILRSVEVFFLQRNRTPEVATLRFLAPGVVMVPVPSQNPDQEAVARAEAAAGGRKENSRNGGRSSPPPRKTFEEGMRTVQWVSHDPNGDDLVHDVDLRSIADDVWQSLARDRREQFLVIDTRGLPDGSYHVRVTARDDPSNPASRALAGERTSEPLDIDNTAPTVEEMEVEAGRDGRWISFVVRDSFSGVQRVEYSVDAGPWRAALPEDGIPDGPEERFRIDLGDLPGPAHTFAVRARDRLGNTGAGRLVLP